MNCLPQFAVQTIQITPNTLTPDPGFKVSSRPRSTGRRYSEFPGSRSGKTVGRRDVHAYQRK